MACFLSHKSGASLSEAVKIFLLQVVLQKGLPFEANIPSQETMNALEQTQRNKNESKTNDSPQELFEEMDKWRRA